jgi:hypothetical protein
MRGTGDAGEINCAAIADGAPGICESSFVSPTQSGLEKASKYDNIKN